MSLGQTIPFGLRDVRLTPYTTPACTALGVGVDLPASRTLSFTESEDFEELRGDDKVVASHGSGPKVAWSLESGGISLEAWKVLNGGTITESGSTPNQVKRYRKLITDQRPYFQIEGQSISDNGGDTHIVLHRCKATGDLTGEFGDGEFFLTQADGEGYGSNVSANQDTLFDVVQNETITSIA